MSAPSGRAGDLRPIEVAMPVAEPSFVRSILKSSSPSRRMSLSASSVNVNEVSAVPLPEKVSVLPARVTLVVARPASTAVRKFE